MKCPQCGVEVVQEGVFCHQCGARLGEPAEAPAAEASGNARFRQAVASRQGGDNSEQTVWEGTYCYKAMFGAWVLAGVATVAAAVAAVLFWATGIVPLVAGGLVVLLWLYLAALGLYRRWSVRYRLTNHRFFHEMGLLRRVTDRIEVIDMDDITFEQGPIERLLGVGTIRITSSDRTHPELVIRGIDNVREVAGQMDNLRREERIRRGLHIEAV